MSDTKPLVLITGGSSFVGLHVIHQAVQQSYRVRTTIRSTAKKQLILDALKDWDGALDYSSIEFVEADLLQDKGWTEAAQGVDYVLHVASPFPSKQPKDENELIRPAKEGTLRVLKAAKASSTCKRVVVTSSIVAVSYGNEPSDGSTYTEQDWTNVDGPGVYAYVKSKTLAEKAAWQYVQEGEGKGLELSTVNPVGIFGPQIRTQDESSSCDLVRSMLKGAFPAVPHVALGVVDVRDVASLHLLAMTKPEAAGQRHIAVGDAKLRTLLDISRTLKTHFNEKASKAPTRELPDWFVKFGAVFMSDLKVAKDNLGKTCGNSNDKAVALGWKPRTPEEAVIATAQRLMDKGDV